MTMCEIWCKKEKKSAKSVFCVCPQCEKESVLMMVNYSMQNYVQGGKNNE